MIAFSDINNSIVIVFVISTSSEVQPNEVRNVYKFMLIGSNTVVSGFTNLTIFKSILCLEEKTVILGSFCIMVNSVNGKF